MKMFNTATSLLGHQKDACEKLYRFKVGALFMEMGTGKTRTALELIHRKQKHIDKVVYLCPVNLKDTVEQEILKHTDLTVDDIYLFNSKTSFSTIPAGKCFYIAGIESMSTSRRMKLCLYNLITEKTMVLLDESTYIKTHNSKRTTFITFSAEKAKYRLILTGTPLTQGVIDLFAQMKFLSPKILGYRSFHTFAANHLEYSEKYPGMIINTHNTVSLAAKINPFVYQVTKKECLELPDKHYESYHYSMTMEQRRIYEQIKEDVLSELDEPGNDAGFCSYIIFKLFTELQKCLSGLFCPHGRIDLLKSIADEIPADKKVIIWAKYLFDIESIKQALGAECVEFTGNIPEHERKNQIKLFKESKRFFVATPSSGGHGLTLTEASFVIFYNNSFKYSERLQAEDRCHRIGQTEKVTYIDMSCRNSIDERILDALRNKKSIADEFREKVEQIKKDKKISKEKFRELIKTL